MSQIYTDDYYALYGLIQDTLLRVRDGVCSVDEGQSDLMHPLSAWRNGDSQEVAPRIKMITEKWEKWQRTA
jgi:hypothetical protein